MNINKNNIEYKDNLSKQYITSTTDEDSEYYEHVLEYTAMKLIL